MDDQEEALRTRAEARVGSTLRDKYRLDRVLGIGGMATVFAATHRNQAELAVKVLHPELSLRDDLRKRFLREGYVGNSVKHPGAVLVVDDDVAEDGSAFLVMELLRGASLEDLWERAGRHLDGAVVVALAIQLLDVLAAAHEKLIVHRDLKPANLFLTLDGTLKVLDFGIARLRDAVGGSEHATRTGTLMGTPAFMAPEQAQAIAAEIDGQTDLWAVGATMFTLLSGQLVHEGDNSSQLLIRAGTARARPLSSVAPGVDAAVAEVVDRALAFEKASRWATAAGMRDALIAAASTAFGRAPGREVLTSLVEHAAVSRASGAGRDPARTTDPLGSASSPRFVVGDAARAAGNDPTFATPSSPTGSRGSSAASPGLSVRPPLPGGSTANPVSAEAAGSRRARGPLPIAGVVTAIALVVAVAAVGFALSRPKPTDATIAAPVVSAPPGQASTGPSPVAVPAPPPPPPEVPALPSPPPVPALSAPVPPVASVAPPVPSPAAASRQSRPATATPAAKPSATPVDCTPPYTLDSDGNKKWKLECVSK